MLESATTPATEAVFTMVPPPDVRKHPQSARAGTTFRKLIVRFLHVNRSLDRMSVQVSRVDGVAQGMVHRMLCFLPLSRRQASCLGCSTKSPLETLSNQEVRRPGTQWISKLINARKKAFEFLICRAD